MMTPDDVVLKDVARYAIGDIQGCMASLDRLLALIAFSPARDQLWLVGDLVNRGRAMQCADCLRLADRTHLAVARLAQQPLEQQDVGLLVVDDQDARVEDVVWLDHLVFPSC